MELRVVSHQEPRLQTPVKQPKHDQGVLAPLDFPHPRDSIPQGRNVPAPRGLQRRLGGQREPLCQPPPHRGQGFPAAKGQKANDGLRLRDLTVPLHTFDCDGEIGGGEGERVQSEGPLEGGASGDGREEVLRPAELRQPHTVPSYGRHARRGRSRGEWECLREGGQGEGPVPATEAAEACDQPPLLLAREPADRAGDEVVDLRYAGLWDQQEQRGQVHPLLAWQAAREPGDGRQEAEGVLSGDPSQGQRRVLLRLR
mmetsp:Transcript_8561/g.25787  ORF Transcript_8561/g.25787 Transcript_8561/m.25787 type:complete len:256 (-) Transcript_8561:742-1509(-)